MATHPSKIVNPMKHGRQSKLVKDFLKKHNLILEFPSTGSFSKDMALSIAAYHEKQEAVAVAMDLLRSRDARALGMYNQLVQLEMKLANFEAMHANDAVTLMNNPMYLNWQKLKFEILKHFERMKFDLEKIKVEQNIKSIKREDSDILYVVEDEDVRQS